MLVDPNQLENALLNLCINACVAMPDVGQIAIAITCASIADDGDLAPGGYVQLSVRDSGIGMTAGQLEQAFDPYFTTKPPGKGAGLGLSMVYGCARQTGADLVAKPPDIDTLMRKVSQAMLHG